MENKKIAETLHSGFELCLKNLIEAWVVEFVANIR